MTQTSSSLWARYRAGLVHDARTGFSLDVSRMDLPDAPHPRTDAAFDAMEALENGAIANPDEQRMVGHYWLRDPDRAPNAELRAQVTQPLEALEKFAADVHAGKIVGEKGEKFSQVLVVGIGGSALGPQFVAQALTRGPATDPAKSFFFDNTDPDGFDKVLEQLGGVVGLARTLTVVISKSGGTKETRNGMVEAAAAYARAGLHFARHAVAVTGDGSELDKVAKKGAWLATFPMYDWIGGRTSELSAVGLLPAALQGFDVRAMLRGAKEMDALTRVRDAKKNPAMVLANAWFHATGGKGQKDMVVLPYKDRLELFSRYLQQLVMESLGKEKDLAGATAHQGIAVYGNKGSTDQHAYVQQLRDGVSNFFVTFIEVLRDRDEAARDLEVEPGVTAGDYLLGFLEGTRRALYEAGRPSVTVTIPRADAHGVGMLIALYERTVGFYATLVNINAYHQPGVEAGKKAAAAVLAVQGKAVRALQKAGKAMTAEEVAHEAGIDDPETVFKILRHLSANPHRGVHALDEASGDPGAVRFTVQAPAK